MEACPKGADYGGKYNTTMGSSAPQASIPAPFLGSIFNRLLAATRQALGQGGLEVFSARIAGTVDKRPSLLLGPIARADTRCRVREMTEGFLDQRGFRIIATTVEQAPQSHHPDLRREFRSLAANSRRRSAIENFLPQGGKERGWVDGEIDVPDDRNTVSTACTTPSPGTGRLEPNSDQAGRAPHWRLLEAQ
jgi:hypothetical protein